MPSVNEQIADAAIRHRLALLRFEAGAVDDVLAVYDRAFSEVLDEIVAYMADPARGARRALALDRLRAVAAELADRIRAAFPAAEAELRARLEEAGAAEVAWQQRAIGDRVGASWVRVPTSAVAAAIAEPIGGNVWTATLAVDLVEAEDAVQAVLGQAFARGLSTERTADLLRQSGRLVETYRNRIVAVVRTETQRVANATALRSYQANLDVVGGVQWLATLDSRTCLICAPLQGTVYNLDPATGEPVGLERPPPAHPRCRCFLAPITRSWDVILGRKPVTGTPADWDGRASEAPDFEEWLRRQPAAEQEEFFESTERRQLWLDGTVPLEGFARGGRVLNLGELAALYRPARGYYLRESCESRVGSPGGPAVEAVEAVEALPSPVLPRFRCGPC